MLRCLDLARLGAGKVAPNPMVGAVLVYKDRIIGEGYHKYYGAPHAEVNCLSNVAEENQPLISLSTLYVSLEPCCHYGKTPPCTDLIINNKISRVVIGSKDPNSQVAGKGIDKLINAGIQVTTGILEKECRIINKRFFCFHEKKRPYIILKWAESFNGMIGKQEERVYITNEYTNRRVHQWRSEEAVILVGKNTALQDDPSLTTRSWPGKSPVRMVIDRKLELPLSLKIFNSDSPTIVFNTIKSGMEGNIKYFKVERSNILEEILIVTHQEGLQSIIVEGGKQLLQSFIDAELWDEARILRNEEMIIDDGIPSPVLNNAILMEKERIVNDLLTIYKR